MKLAIAILALGLGAACGGDEAGGPDGGAGAACGGRGHPACPADQYCDFPDNRCGVADAAGRCTPRPTFCPSLLVPELTCGCDRTVYSSACDATLAGADLDESGACDLTPGTFACGYRQCSGSNEFCQRAGSDVGGEPDGFACRALPAGCQGTASCGCLAGEPCGDRCTGDAASGVTLTCLGG